MVALIAYYLIVGTGFMFVMDLVLQYIEAEPFNNWERIVGIAFWPIWLIVFIFYFIKEMFQN